MILSNFPLIAIYWYTYDRISPSLHLAVGLLMALTSSLIPFNFRTIMAFTNQPIGLVGGQVENILLYSNPSLPPLYAHTIFASLSTAGFVICAGAGLAWYTNRGYRDVNMKLFKHGVTAGLGFLVPQALAGAWYAWTLGANVPSMFASITGLATERPGGGGSPIDLASLFATKLVLVGYLFLGGMWLRPAGNQEVLSRLALVAGASLGLLSCAVVIIGETMQEYSHLPYLVIGQFTAQELLTPTFPLTPTTAAGFMIGLGAFIIVLFAVLYVEYVKK